MRVSRGFTCVSQGWREALDRHVGDQLSAKNIRILLQAVLHANYHARLCVSKLMGKEKRLQKCVYWSKGMSYVYHSVQKKERPSTVCMI